MIVNTKDIKDICSNIANAVDANELNNTTEVLEMYVEDSMLFLNITNGEYFASFKIPSTEDIDFHCSVNAEMFLRLMNKITTDTIKLVPTDNFLYIYGNGEYKLPMIYEDDKLMELPKIELQNVVEETDLEAGIFTSIYQYNTKELLKGLFVSAVQKLYYVDKYGAITFTTGACVNNFDFKIDVKLLFSARVVNLFNIFSSTDTIHFKVAVDTETGIEKTKVAFETPNFVLTCILPIDTKLVNSIPVKIIREKTTDSYLNEVKLSKTELYQALERLEIFTDNVHKYLNFNFGKEGLTISDTTGDNKEIITYDVVTKFDDEYSNILDLKDVKLVLTGITSSDVGIKFGNSNACVLSSGNIHYVVPECVA